MKLAVIARQSGDTLTLVGYVSVDDSAVCVDKSTLFPAKPDQAHLVLIKPDRPVVAGKKWQSVCGTDDSEVFVEADKNDFENGASGGNSTPTATSTLIGHYQA